MTEFALVLPILALLLFGVIQFGIVFNNYITLTDAVRAGARKGAVGRHLNNPGAAVEKTVRDAAADLEPAGPRRERLAEPELDGRAPTSPSPRPIRTRSACSGSS